MCCNVSRCISALPLLLYERTLLVCAPTDMRKCLRSKLVGLDWTMLHVANLRKCIGQILSAGKYIGQLRRWYH